MSTFSVILLRFIKCLNLFPLLKDKLSPQRTPSVHQECLKKEEEQSYIIDDRNVVSIKSYLINNPHEKQPSWDKSRLSLFIASDQGCSCLVNPCIFHKLKRYFTPGKIFVLAGPLPVSGQSLFVLKDSNLGYQRWP